MKTLQEKAQVYARKECYYNVNCDTNSSCDGCQWLDNSITENQMRNSSKGFIEGYKTRQHETRWRNVMKEDLPALNVPVLVKRESDAFGGNPSEHQLCYLGKDDELGVCWFQCGTEKYACRITHWKPIE